MNFYEKEMRSLFANNSMITDAKFCGKTMLGRLDDELKVKLQFVSTKFADQYDAIRATVINRSEGEVDKETFRFSDIIGKQRNSAGEVEPHMWEYGEKPEWYIPISTSDRAHISETVLDYVGMYQQTESLDMSDMKL